MDEGSDLKNRGIGRARMFMGAVLLLAAAITWAIGLMMSPHGTTVAQGTEYLRSTIVTFKRNGAIGTLILCAVAAWLLFPARRPNKPRRDWALMTVLGLLAASSLYTLIGLRPSPSGAMSVDENYATADMNIDGTASAVGPVNLNSGTEASAISIESTSTRTGAKARSFASPEKVPAAQEPDVAKGKPDGVDAETANNSADETPENRVGGTPQ
jgi:hypothetical protein